MREGQSHLGEVVGTCGTGCPGTSMCNHIIVARLETFIEPFPVVEVPAWKQEQRNKRFRPRGK